MLEIRTRCRKVGLTELLSLAHGSPVNFSGKLYKVVHYGLDPKTETIDMGIEADAKTFSLFSGQSPIGVGGYFAAPSIDPISGERASGLAFDGLVPPAA